MTSSCSFISIKSTWYVCCTWFIQAITQIHLSTIIVILSYGHWCQFPLLCISTVSSIHPYIISILHLTILYIQITSISIYNIIISISCVYKTPLLCIGIILFPDLDIRSACTSTTIYIQRLSRVNVFNSIISIANTCNCPFFIICIMVWINLNITTIKCCVIIYIKNIIRI